METTDTKEFKLEDFQHVIDAFEPINEWIIGKPIVHEKVGSLFVLDSFANSQTFSKVFIVSTGEGAIGPSGERIQNRVFAGETVLIRASTDIIIAGEKLKILTERNIVGVCHANEDTQS